MTYIYAFANRHGIATWFALRLSLPLGAITLASWLASPARAQTMSDAQQAAVQRHSQCATEHFKRHLLETDTNRDGKIDAAEWKAARQRKETAAKKNYDKNRNNLLDRDEREQMRRDRIANRFEQVDTDGSGSISLTEATDSCGPLGLHFQAVDSDHNRSISWSEFEQGAKLVKKRHRRHIF